MAAARVLQEAAVASMAAPAGGEEVADPCGGYGGGASPLGPWHDLAVAACILTLAAGTAGLSWRWRRAPGPRGGSAAAGELSAPRAEARVLGLPLGRELFDKLFSPEVVPDESACVVCLLPMGGEGVPFAASLCRRLGCGHSFHSDCIDRWWLQTGDIKLRCPVCRRAQVPGATEVSV